MRNTLKDGVEIAEQIQALQFFLANPEFPKYSITLTVKQDIQRVVG